MPGIKTNIDSYIRLYETMEYDHSYPNINLVRLEKWFLKEPGRVLEHGCGYGENAIFLASRGYEVTAVDISENLMDYVRLKCHMRKVPPTLYHLECITGEGPLPFDDESFDYVVSLGVLHYMGDQDTACRCLQDLSRCLKPEGKMIISVVAPENYFVTSAQPLGNASYAFKGREVDKDVDLDQVLWVPDDERSFAAIFPENCEVHEVGSWDNDYCGVKGKHFVSLATKRS